MIVATDLSVITILISGRGPIVKMACQAAHDKTGQIRRRYCIEL